MGRYRLGHVAADAMRPTRSRVYTWSVRLSVEWYYYCSMRIANDLLITTVPPSAARCRLVGVIAAIIRQIGPSAVAADVAADYERHNAFLVIYKRGHCTDRNGCINDY